MELRSYYKFRSLVLLFYYLFLLLYSIILINLLYK